MMIMGHLFYVSYVLFMSVVYATACLSNVWQFACVTGQVAYSTSFVALCIVVYF